MVELTCNSINYEPFFRLPERGNKMSTFFSEEKRKQIIEGAFSEVEEGKTMIQTILETYALFAIANYENCNKENNTVEANLNIHGSPYIVKIEATVVERNNDTQR